MKTERYHYTDSGLQDVYLRNGFNVIETPYGRAVSIDDLDGLHRAIARALIRDKAALSGPAIRFLRKELGLSQDGLARLLGCTDQTVARWEKSKVSVDPSADRLIRLSVTDWLDDDVHVRVALQELAERDEEVNGHKMMHRDRGHWMAETLLAA